MAEKNRGGKYYTEAIPEAKVNGEIDLEKCA